MRQLEDFFTANDHFARHCGIELLSGSPGHARARMNIQPYHFNGAGTVHGGALFTLADFTFAVAANGAGRLALAINASTAFLQAVRAGTLEAEARELITNRRLGHYEVSITDQEGRLIAMFQGTAYRKEQSLFPEDETPSGDTSTDRTRPGA